MEYNFTEIEIRVKAYWDKEQVYTTTNNTDNPKCYVLDMFPYPSGAGLHVGHPLGYIASDIYARYKKLKGFNVLHPMGFDAFGLPAEQYALETGQHPVDTTRINIARYKEQLYKIGFSYDWCREVNTSNPEYYKWTQWIFLQLFHSWYDKQAQKARPIKDLKAIFEQKGNAELGYDDNQNTFTHEEWNGYDEKKKRNIIMQYRIAYLDFATVWWCEALGTVLANDEVLNGVSERGGHPVERKLMRQWFLRITDYAERLLDSLETLDWSEAMKEMQRNWIGKSTGAEIQFNVQGNEDAIIEVFTTRPDTLFGVDFIVLAPEHELVETLTTPEQKEDIIDYINYVNSRSERERMSEVKVVTGCFTGAYAIHPISGKALPIWIAEYVLAGYGTGAIMAVPSGDDRDHVFAKNFGIQITNIFGANYTGDKAFNEKTGNVFLENSDFLTGMNITSATQAIIKELEQRKTGKRKVNYKLRDAGFSRQRYWGEPFPIVYIDDVPYSIDEEPLINNPFLNQLPVELPKVDQYKPGPNGQGPLANLTDWVNVSFNQNGSKGKRETNTMPGYAGSSWYFLRYMDPNNTITFADRKATDYWQQVDLYVGGTEHAVGHLLYSRMWTKVLFDLGHIGFDEPFKKLLNQGMIQGQSRFYYQLQIRIVSIANIVSSGMFIFVSKNQVEIINNIKDNSKLLIEYLKKYNIDFDINIVKGYENIKFNIEINFLEKHVDVNFVDGFELIIDAFKKWRPEYASAKFITEEDGKFICHGEIEKMSKSKYNVVNPDDIVVQYGADTFRMYEMFLGPIEMSKPWDTKGIEGVHRFLKKLWRLYVDEQKGWVVTDEVPTDAELRILHKTIKKISEDIEKFSFNTSISQFMITVNDLSGLGCHKRAILEPLAILICPFAPHIAEEIWQNLCNKGSIIHADFPICEERYLIENTKKYPIAVNGKTRAEMEFELEAEASFIEQTVLADTIIQKWIEGKPVKKFIYVKGKMINIVV